MVAIDDVLDELITTKLNEVRSDPTVLNEIFKGKATEKIESIKQFILSNDIKVVKHHPRIGADWPCYAIVLEGSTESDQTIGQSGDDYTELPLSFMTDGWIGSDSTLISRDPIPPSDITQMYTYDVEDDRRVCHMKAKKGTSRDKGIFLDLEHSVLEGGYVSLTQMDNVVIRVKSSRVGTFLRFGFGKETHDEHVYSVTISEKNVWERVVLDISGVPDDEKDTIRFMSFVVTDDSRDIDIFIDEICAETSQGYIYDETFLDHRYRIESWSNNADFTLDMHTMLLWWMLKYRTWMQKAYGVIRQRVDGADIMFQPEYYPEFTYVRGLVFSCSTIEPIPREADLGALKIRVGKIDKY